MLGIGFRQKIKKFIKSRMMIETLILVLLAGVALGIFFFGGLWWTVRRGLVAKNPWVYFSLVVLV